MQPYIEVLDPRCYLARHGRMEHDDPMPSCDGQLIRAHLIPRQRLKRFDLDVADPRTYVIACGGISGAGGHHGMFDFSKRLRLDYTKLPKGLIEFCEEHDQMQWLQTTYEIRGATCGSDGSTARPVVRSRVSAATKSGSTS